MEIDKKLLDSEITDYYDSVKEMFHYRLKNDWKIIASQILNLFSTLYLFLNIIPILPYLSDTYLSGLFNFMSKHFVIGDLEFTFMIKWGIGSTISVFLWMIIYPTYRYWKSKEYKKALKHKYMNFCYAFILRQDLKNFLINGNESHLDKSVNYFNKITHWIINATIESNDKSTVIELGRLKNELIKQFEWFRLSQETIDIIEAYNGIENKVIERLKKKVEIEKLIPLIDTLTLYYFSIIKPDIVYGDNGKLGDNKNDFIKNFAMELIELKEFEYSCENEENKKMRLEKITKAINSQFYDSNIIVMFLCWIILLTLIFIPFATLIINFLTIDIDSTILIGLLTAPFLGAITFTATIYTKRQK